MFKRLIKNWKTTLAGAVVAGTGIATALHFITNETAAAIMTIAGSLGLLAAKDDNVTSGTKAQEGAIASKPESLVGGRPDDRNP